VEINDVAESLPLKQLCSEPQKMTRVELGCFDAWSTVANYGPSLPVGKYSMSNERRYRICLLPRWISSQMAFTFRSAPGGLVPSHNRCPGDDAALLKGE